MLYRHTKIVAAFMLGLVTLPFSSVPAAAQEGFYGQIYMTAAYCRQGSVEAKGQRLPLLSNSALYSLLLDAYGPLEGEEFALPDMRSRSPIGLGRPVSAPPIVRGQKVGSELSTMSNFPRHNHAEAPHTHTVSPHSHIAQLHTSASVPNVPTPQGHAFGTFTAGSQYAADTGTLVPMADGSVTVSKSTQDETDTTDSFFTATGESGSGQAVDVRDPFVGIKFCIVTDGTYPSRP